MQMDILSTTLIVTLTLTSWYWLMTKVLDVPAKMKNKRRPPLM